MRTEITNKIIQEIELLSSQKIPNPDFNIFSQGFLDSLNVLHIIVFIETEFCIQVDPYDISIDVLSSVNKIVDFIESKLDNA
jgi:acyl carrier protein